LMWFSRNELCTAKPSDVGFWEEVLSRRQNVLPAILPVQSLFYYVPMD
jgi:hypothetical protein